MRRSVSGLGFFLLLPTLQTASADPVDFSGKVVDSDGTPIAWALLKVEGSAIIGQTGADGSFSLTGEAAIVIWPDPQPPGFRAVVPEAPAWFLPDGRATGNGAVASLLLLARAHADRPAALAFSVPESGIRPPQPPRPGAEAARVYGPEWNITVSMANHQTTGFPQPAATAKSLVLTLPKSATDTAAYRAEKKLCLDTLNGLRATLNLPKLAWSGSLAAFADQGARYDAERNKAHAHFSVFSARAIPSDAENEVPGWPLRNYLTVAKVVQEGAKMMWDEGPGGGHYENIKGSHTQVGCGIYATPSGGVWVIHDFK